MIEIKQWGYEEFPAFNEKVDGAQYIETTGNEIGVTYLPDVVYQKVGDLELHLQILQPYTRKTNQYGNGVWPCIVYVVGSAWKKQNMYADIPEISKLARRGYVVAMVEYRHSEVAPYPAPGADTCAAVNFMRKHAQDYHLDPNRIYLAGNSSGGHTALLAVLQGARVSGVIDYYGSVSVMEEDDNPSTLDHCLPTSPEGMEMGGINLLEKTKLRKELTIETHVTKGLKMPPVLIIHGTKDRFVNTRQSVRLYQKLRSCGKEVYLYLLEAADHGGAEFFSEEVTDIVVRFLRHC